MPRRSALLLAGLAATCCDASPFSPKLPSDANLSNLIQTYLDMGQAKFWLPSKRSQVRVVEDVCKPRGFQEVNDPKQATFLWLTQHRVFKEENLWMQGNGNLVYNFLHGHGLMTTKHKLVKLLRDSGTSYAQPPSLHLHDADSCSDFLVHHSERCPIWVSKESELSQGHGIAVLGSLDKYKAGVDFDGKRCKNFDRHRKQTIERLREEMKKDGEDDSDLDNDPGFVMQCHVDRPFLIDRKKTEMRFYWVIASLEPLMAFLHTEGTVRLSTHDFEHDDFENPLKHIGNTRAQKAADPAAYAQDPDSRKQTFSQLEEFLRNSGRISSAEGVWRKSLVDAMGHALKRAVRENLPRLRRKNSPTRHFLLLGADCILEDETMNLGQPVPRSQDGPDGVMALEGGLRVWLTEVQDTPGMSTDSEVKKVMIPTMLTDVVNLVLEIDHRKTHGLPLDKLHSADPFLQLTGVDDYFAQEEELPSGWFSNVHASTGERYYWNLDVDNGKPQSVRPSLKAASDEL